MPTRHRLPARALLAFLMTAATLPAVDIVAHRGASFEAPENTLASSKLAWQENADAVELDVWYTKDGKDIVSHDGTTLRTTGREGKIAELTFAELRTLDAGSWKHPKYAGEKLPTLNELFDLVPAGKRIFIEIKTGPEIVPTVEAALDRSRLTARQTVIITFNYETAKAAKKSRPQYLTFHLVSYKPAKDTGLPPKSLDELIADCRAAKLDGLDLQSTWPLTAADVKKIKAAGLQLHVWTIDDPATARRWKDLGVDSITTNRPGWLREMLTYPASHDAEVAAKAPAPKAAPAAKPAAPKKS